MIDISNIEIKIKNINKNYKKIYNFIFLYKNELINIINDNNSKNLLNENINNIKIDKIITKLDNHIKNIENLSINTYLNIYKNIKKIYFNYADMNSVDGGEAGIGYGSLYLRNKSVRTDERKLLITFG